MRQRAMRLKCIFIIRKSLVQANASIRVKAVAGTGFCVTLKPEQSSSVQSTSAEPKSTNKGNDQW